MKDDIDDLEIDDVADKGIDQLQDGNLNDGIDDDFNIKDDFSFNEFGSDMQVPMEKHSDLLKDLTNFNGYHRDLVNGWLGLTWNENSKLFEKDKHSTPIMNQRCATWCVTFLKTYTRKNNIITHIGREEYVNIMWEVIQTIWLNIPLKRPEFGIKNLGDCLRICNELEHAVALVLMGAGDGRYNKLLTETTQRSESITGRQNQQFMPHQIAIQQDKNYLQKGIDYLKGG